MVKKAKNPEKSQKKPQRFTERKKKYGRKKISYKKSYPLSLQILGGPDLT